MLSELRLTDRVTVAGELDAAAVSALYDSADLFVLATRSETHPLSVVEALARGLPIVSTTTGAIPRLVRGGPAVAGLLAPPGDVEAMSNAIAQVLDDRACRDRLAAGARRVREALPTWDVAAARMEAALDGLGRSPAHPEPVEG